MTNLTGTETGLRERRARILPVATRSHFTPIGENLRVELEFTKQDRYRGKAGVITRLEFKVTRNNIPLFSREIRTEDPDLDQNGVSTERIFPLLRRLEALDEDTKSDPEGISKQKREVLRSIHRIANLDPYTCTERINTPLIKYSKDELLTLLELDLYLAPPTRRLDTLTTLPPTESLFRPHTFEKLYKQCETKGFHAIYLDRKYMRAANDAGMGKIIDETLRRMPAAAAKALNPAIEAMGLQGGFDPVLDGLCRSGGDEFVLVVPRYEGAKEHIQAFLEILDQIRDENFSTSKLSQSDKGREAIRRATLKKRLTQKNLKFKPDEIRVNKGVEEPLLKKYAKFLDLHPVVIDLTAPSLENAVMAHINHELANPADDPPSLPNIMGNSVFITEVSGSLELETKRSREEFKQTLAAAIVYSRDNLVKGEAQAPVKLTPTKLEERVNRKHVSNFLEGVDKLVVLEEKYDRIVQQIRDDKIPTTDAIRKLCSIASCDPYSDITDIADTERAVVRANYGAHILLSDLFGSKCPKKLHVFMIDKENFGIENDEKVGGENNANEIFSELAKGCLTYIQKGKLFVRINGGSLVCISESTPVKAEIAKAIRHTYRAISARRVGEKSDWFKILRAGKRALAHRYLHGLDPEAPKVPIFTSRPKDLTCSKTTSPMKITSGISIQDGDIRTTTPERSHWTLDHLIKAWKEADKATISLF